MLLSIFIPSLATAAEEATRAVLALRGATDRERSERHTHQDQVLAAFGLTSALPQVRHARDLLARPENTVTTIAKLLGVSRNTIYNYVPELKGGRLALAEAPSTPELPQPTRSED